MGRTTGRFLRWIRREVDTIAIAQTLEIFIGNKETSARTDVAREPRHTPHVLPDVAKEPGHTPPVLTNVAREP